MQHCNNAKCTTQSQIRDSKYSWQLCKVAAVVCIRQMMHHLVSSTQLSADIRYLSAVASPAHRLSKGNLYISAVQCVQFTNLDCKSRINKLMQSKSTHSVTDTRHSYSYIKLS